MARNKIGLQVKGFEEYMEKLDNLGGGEAMKRGTEAALKASKNHINPQIDAKMSKNNLPAHGKYSTGDTRKSLSSDMTVIWSGAVGEIDIGFDFSKSGLKSIFLMYGTPRMKPVSGLKSAIYGSKSKREIAEIQEAELNKVIKRIMEAE